MIGMRRLKLCMINTKRDRRYKSSLCRMDIFCNVVIVCCFLYKWYSCVIIFFKVRTIHAVFPFYQAALPSPLLFFFHAYVRHENRHHYGPSLLNDIIDTCLYDDVCYWWSKMENTKAHVWPRLNLNHRVKSSVFLLMLRYVRRGRGRERIDVPLNNLVSLIQE
jgi:hypothetical protein